MGEMEAVVVRRSAHEATAEAVLCSAALPGSAARAREGAGEGESWRGRVEMERAHAGVKKARPGALWPARTERWRRAAVVNSTRRLYSDAGRPLCRSIQLVQTRTGRLTACFLVDLSTNPWLLRANLLNKFRRPKYQLQMLFNDLVLIRNRN